MNGENNYNDDVFKATFLPSLNWVEECIRQKITLGVIINKTHNYQSTWNMWNICRPHTIYTTLSIRDGVSYIYIYIYIYTSINEQKLSEC